MCSGGETEFTGLACKLVKAFIGLLTIEMSSMVLMSVEVIKQACYVWFGRPKVACLGGGGKDRKLSFMFNVYDVA